MGELLRGGRQDRATSHGGINECTAMDDNYRRALAKALYKRPRGPRPRATWRREAKATLLDIMAKRPDLRNRDLAKIISPVLSGRGLRPPTLRVIENWLSEIKR